MGNTYVAEALIAVCSATVAMVTFRPKMPRAVGLAAWVVLIWLCAVAITNTENPQARALTAATAWATSQVVGIVLGLVGQSIQGGLYGARFAIADSVAILFAIDLLVLALVSTRRQANSWVPVTRLGEWMLLPRLGAAQPEPVAVSGVDEINRWFDAWSRVAAASAVARSIAFLIRLRDVEMPRSRRGVTWVALGAGVAWRRVAAGRAQVGEVRTSRMASDSPDAAPAVRRPRRRVAAGPPQLKSRPAARPRQKRVSAGGAPKIERKRRRVATEPAPVVMEIVDIKVLARRVRAIKAEAAGAPVETGTTPRKPRRRTAATRPAPDKGTRKNGTEKHRQGRLAS